MELSNKDAIAMVDGIKRKNKLSDLLDEYGQIKLRIELLTSELIFDQILVQRLKRRKLQLKDQISFMRQSSCDDIIA